MRNLFAICGKIYGLTHMSSHPLKLDKLDILKNSRPGDTVKSDVADLRCDLCEQDIDDIPTLMDHLYEIHNQPIAKNFDSGIVPYVLANGFTCALCGKSFDSFAILNEHMFAHAPKCACFECGKEFAVDKLKRHILRTHENNKFQPKPGGYKDGRHNAILIFEFSNACPFKWRGNVFGCAYCTFTSPEFTDLKIHMSVHPIKSDRIKIFRNSQSTDIMKADVTDLKCELCHQDIENLTKLMIHLKDEHDKPIVNDYGYGIIPYKLRDGFKCAYSFCTESFDSFPKLNMHVKSHNKNCTCAQCDQYFSDSKKLEKHLIRMHDHTHLTKPRLMYNKSELQLKSKNLLGDARCNANIILKFSNACLFKWHRNMFGCGSCKFTSVEFGPIRAHVETKKCDGMYMRNLRSTAVLKADVTNLKCKLCDQVFHDLKTLLFHLGEVHFKPIKKEYDPGLIPYLLCDGYVCAFCGDQFDRFTKLNNHMNEHFPNCICTYCGLAFTSEVRLKTHTKKHTQETVFKCLQCNETFATSHQKRKHRISKHNEFIYRCPYCNEVFMNYPLRVKHLNEKHGKKIEYPCKLCSKVFQTVANRAHHVRNVHGKGKFEHCSICNYTCLTAYKLKRHMIRHGGERKYKCDVCFKAYPRKSTLSLHMRIHDSDKRFICVHCGAAFVQKSSLNSHTKTHHA